MKLAFRFASRSPVPHSEYPLRDVQISPVAPSIFAAARTKAALNGAAALPLSPLLQELRGEGLAFHGHADTCSAGQGPRG